MAVKPRSRGALGLEQGGSTCVHKDHLELYSVEASCSKPQAPHYHHHILPYRLLSWSKVAATAQVFVSQLARIQCALPLSIYSPPILCLSPKIPNLIESLKKRKVQISCSSQGVKSLHQGWAHHGFACVPIAALWPADRKKWKSANPKDVGGLLSQTRFRWFPFSNVSEPQTTYLSPPALPLTYFLRE